jgi:iron transport multicopper oxidase
MHMHRYATCHLIQSNYLAENTEQGQYVDGLRAPLVIHPSNEVHSYDAEYTVILGDWYHNEHSTLLNRFISISNPNGGEPVPGQPDKFLIVAGFGF